MSLAIAGDRWRGILTLNHTLQIKSKGIFSIQNFWQAISPTWMGVVKSTLKGPSQQQYLLHLSTHSNNLGEIIINTPTQLQIFINALGLYLDVIFQVCYIPHQLSSSSSNMQLQAKKSSKTLFLSVREAPNGLVVEPWVKSIQKLKKVNWNFDAMLVCKKSLFTKAF